MPLRAFSRLNNSAFCAVCRSIVILADATITGLALLALETHSIAAWMALY